MKIHKIQIFSQQFIRNSMKLHKIQRFSKQSIRNSRKLHKVQRFSKQIIRNCCWTHDGRQLRHWIVRLYNYACYTCCLSGAILAHPVLRCCVWPEALADARRILAFAPTLKRSSVWEQTVVSLSLPLSQSHLNASNFSKTLELESRSVCFSVTLSVSPSLSISL